MAGSGVAQTLPPAGVVPAGGKAGRSTTPPVTALTIGAIRYGPGASGWLAASLSSTTAPATVTVTPTLGSLGAGTYTATVPVSSPYVSSTYDFVAEDTIAVSFTVVPVSGAPVSAGGGKPLSRVGGPVAALTARRGAE